MVIIKAIDISNREDILAGSPGGRTFLASLIAKVERRNETQILFLDFRGIQVATGSFLREAVLGFRNYCLNNNLKVIPVVTNLNETITDELELLLNLKGDVLLTCDLSSENKISNSKILGNLEEKQKVTLKTVLSESEVNAVELEKKYREQEDISATGWNNRLASLVSKGILLEIKRGRQKFYRPVLEKKLWV